MQWTRTFLPEFNFATSRSTIVVLLSYNRMKMRIRFTILSQHRIVIRRECWIQWDRTKCCTLQTTCMRLLVESEYKKHHIFELRERDKSGKKIALEQLWNKAITKNSGLNGIQNHDLCDIGALHSQLSYKANWELITLWDFAKYPQAVKMNKWIHETLYS